MNFTKAGSFLFPLWDVELNKDNQFLLKAYLMEPL